MEVSFVHRARTFELKDGNPLNEVRMLAYAMLSNNSVMTADKTIKYDPAKSLLKYRMGDEIRLNEADFILLSSAFSAEIERKFL